MVQYTCHIKISDFVENFGSGMVGYGSTQVSGLLLSESISDVGSGTGPGHLVQLLDLGSVLPSLPNTLIITPICASVRWYSQ